MISIVQYNLLCSNLSTTKFYVYNKPEYLDSDYRYGEIIKQLDSYIERSRPVFCLQEVSHEWGGKLLIYFISKKYTFIYRYYGDRFQDYMGIAIAVPNEITIKNIYYKRVSDYIPVVNKKNISKYNSLNIFNIFKYLINLIGKITPNIIRHNNINNNNNKDISEYDQYLKAKSRYNMAIIVELSSFKRPIFICNYHMPCLYRFPHAIKLHTLALILICKVLTYENTLIMAGDFNFEPTNDCYKSIINTNMKSAYKNIHLTEPITNIVHTCISKQILNLCLDYIFVSNYATVKHVDEIKETDNIMPNEEFPSDHKPLYAEIII